MEKRKVYVETSVISNLTVRPSVNIADAARQLSTQAWWEQESAYHQCAEDPRHQTGM